LAGTALWNGGTPIEIAGGSAYNHKYPIPVSDGQGGMYVVWMRYDSISGASSPDVFMQHIDNNGAIASGWPLSGAEVAATAGTREYYPRIALTDDQSALFVLYGQGLVGSTSVRLKRFSATDGSATPGWSGSGLVLSNGPNVYPTILNDFFLFTDDGGCAIAFWVEARTSNNGEIYMQRVTDSASILLNTNGKCVGANTTDGTSYLEVEEDVNAESYILVYNDYATWYDVDAKRINIDGTTVWQNLAMTTNTNSAYPKPVSLTSGLLVFYKDITGANRLKAIGADDATGTTFSWSSVPSDFGLIGNFSGFNPNYDFDVTGVSPDHAIAVWNRLDGGRYKIYACNLWLTGENCTDVLDIQERAEAPGQIYPNPFCDHMDVDLRSLSDAVNFSLYDVWGREVMLIRLEGGMTHRIGTGSIAEGLYFYRVGTASGMLIKYGR
jgi:hypothetical protein